MLEVNLTARELEVLKACAEGLSNPAIAKKLFISENTVKAHMANLMEKLNAPSRLVAVVKAIKLGLIE